MNRFHFRFHSKQTFIAFYSHLQNSRRRDSVSIPDNRHRSQLAPPSSNAERTIFGHILARRKDRTTLTGHYHNLAVASSPTKLEEVSTSLPAILTHGIHSVDARHTGNAGSVSWRFSITSAQEFPTPVPWSDSVPSPANSFSTSARNIFNATHYIFLYPIGTAQTACASRNGIVQVSSVNVAQTQIILLHPRLPGNGRATCWHWHGSY